MPRSDPTAHHLWEPHEDAQLLAFVARVSPAQPYWPAANVKGRSWRSCRARWRLLQMTPQQRTGYYKAQRRSAERPGKTKAQEVAEIEKHMAEARARIQERNARWDADTRSEAERIMGDPVPGRSALDAKRAAEALARQAPTDEWTP